DRLMGALVRDPGESVGDYAIRHGSLVAGTNYTLEFIDGRLVIVLPDIDNLLGDKAAAYRAAIVSAKTEPQGPAAFDSDLPGVVGEQTPYTIENEGLRMPEGT